MSFLKSAFKSKPGGTMLGNTLRGVANRATSGLLGNGLMLAAAEKRNSAILQGVGAGLQAAAMATPKDLIANNSTTGASVQTGAQNVAIGAFIQKYALPLMGGVGIIIYFFTKKRR